MKSKILKFLTLAAALCGATAWGATLEPSATDGFYHIASVNDLAQFRDMVNAGTTFNGKTVVQDVDIDLASVENWKPIGNLVSYPSISFAGTFDGKGKTISNLTVSDTTPEYAVAGLFGSLVGTIKNVTLKDVNISSSHYAGALVAYNSGYGASIENCHVIGGTVRSTPESTGDGYDNGDKVGGLVGYIGGTGDAACVVTGCSVKDLTVIAYRDVGGLVGYANQSARVEDYLVENTKVQGDKTYNYKNYSSDAQFDINQVVGEASTSATISAQTSENVKNVTTQVGLPVARIGSTEYATLNAALAEVNNQSGDDVEVKILCDITEALTAKYEFTKNVTFTADSAVLVNCVDRNASMGICNKNGTTLTTMPNVHFKEVGNFGLYRASGSVVVNGPMEALFLRSMSAKDDPSSTATLTINPTATIVYDNATGTGCIRMERNSSVTINGTPTQDLRMPVTSSETGTKTFTIKNATLHSCAFNNSSAGGSLTMLMENAAISINAHNGAFTLAAGGCVGTLTMKGSQITMDSENQLSQVIFDDNDVVNMDATSSIRTTTFTNGGQIKVDMTGATAEQVKIIDIANSTEMALADFGNVTVTAGNYGLKVIDNDLYAVVLPAVAKIGTTEYASFADAVDAATIGDTITVLPAGASQTAPDGWKVDNGKLVPVDGWLISNEAELRAFAAAVNGGNDFAGQTVKLAADISMTETVFTPIGANGKEFKGTFDGNGKTISNLKVTYAANYAGLFGAVFGANIKNLNLVDAVVVNSGENYTGALVGGGYAHIENCTVTGGSVTGVDQVGGVIGYLSCGYVKDCTVDDVDVTANGDRAGGITGKANVDSEYDILRNTVKDCTIVAANKIGAMGSAAGLVGQVMASSANHWVIADNTILNTTTTTAGDSTFVPVGEFRSGSYQANAVTAGHIVRNHWEPETTPSYYDMVNPANSAEYVRIGNFIPVAAIDDMRYATVQEALDAATAGQTVKLLADTTENLVVAEGQDIVLDLNSKNIAAAGTSSAIKNSGTLKIVGSGAVTRNDGAGYVVENSPSGVMEIAGGAFSKTSGASALVNNLGTMTISGGTFSSLNGTKNINIYQETNLGQLDCSPTLTMKGGEFLTTTPGFVIGMDVHVQGGVFPSTSAASYYDAGFGHEKNAAGKYVVSDGFVAKDNKNNFYKSLASAVSTATTAISLVDDVTDDFVVPAENTATMLLYLNGHKLTGDVVNNSGKRLTLGESSVAKTTSDNGILTGTISGDVYVTGGKYVNDPAAYTDKYLYKTSQVGDCYVIVDKTAEEKTAALAADGIVATTGSGSTAAYFTSVQAAWDASTSTTYAKISLMADVEENLVRRKNCNFQLDLNGHEFTGSIDAEIAGAMKAVDFKGNGTAVLTNIKCSTLFVDNDDKYSSTSVVVKNGAVTTVTVKNEGTLSLEGGTYVNAPADKWVAEGYMKTGEGPYVVQAAVAKIGDIYYATLDAAVAAVQEGETITVLNYDEANMTAPEGWKFATTEGVTTLVRKVYVAQIGETKYELINAAFAAVNGQSGDDVTIKILKDVTEELTTDYYFAKNVTLATDVEGGVTLNFGFVYGRGVWALLATNGHVLNIEEDVTITNLSQLFGGFYYDSSDVVNIGGSANLQQLWACWNDVVNVLPTARIVMGYGDGMIKLRCGTLNVTGTANDAADKQLTGGYITADNNGAKSINLKDTYVSTAWLVNAGTGTITLDLDNATLELNHESLNGLNLGADATGTINMKNGSLIVTPKLQNVNVINVDATGLTAPVKVIDYTGTGTMTLAAYGTVNVAEGCIAYVEENDLFVRRANYVAQIGEVKYESLAEAVAAATAGQTVTLIADTTVTAMIPITKNVTIDLNGHVITDMVEGDRVFNFAAAGVDLTIDGTVEGSGMMIPGDVNDPKRAGEMPTYWGFVRCDYPACNITLDGGTYTGPTQNGSFVTTRYTHYTWADDEVWTSVTLNDVAMTTTTRAVDIYIAEKLTINGGTFIAKGGFDNNGGPVSAAITLRNCVAELTEVTIQDSVVDIEASSSEVELNDCNFTAKAGQCGSVTASNIGVSQNGYVEVNGGTYTIVDPNSQTDKTGASIFVYSSGGTVDVNDGTFTGVQDVVRVGTETSYPAAVSEVNIKGGTFSGNLVKYGGADTLNSVNVAGGMFTVDPSDESLSGFVHIADGYMAKALDTTPATWTVVAAVAKIGDTYYATFEDAIAAVQNGETIVVLNYDEVNMESPEGWKFLTNGDVTTLVQKVYVAQITVNETTTKFETIAAALEAVANGQTIMLLADIPDAVAVTRPASANFTIDLNGHKVAQNLSVGFEIASTTSDTLTLTGNGSARSGSVYVGQSDAGDAKNVEGWEDREYVLNIVGDENDPQDVYFGNFYVRTTGTLNIRNTTVHHSYVCGYGAINLKDATLKTEGGVNFYISGRASKKATDKAVITLDHSTLDHGVYELDIGCQGKDYNVGSGLVVLKNESVLKAQDLFLQPNADGSLGTIAVRSEGSTIQVAKSVTIGAGDSIELKDSTMSLATLVNNGTIAIAVTDLTAPVKVIDYTGTGAMTLADYGTVNVAEGCIAYVEENDLFVRRASYVAQIGDVKYESIYDAVAAAVSGNTVELLTDVTLTKPLTIGASANKHAREFTIDLGGHKITGKNQTTVFSIYDDVTLTNGEVDYFGMGTMAYALNTYGNVVIDGVDITDKLNKGGNEVKVNAGATLTLKDGTISCDYLRGGLVSVANGGTFVMEGGKLVNNYDNASSTAACVNAAAGSSVEITGGELNAALVAVWVNSTDVEISGGKIAAPYDIWVNNGKVDISGGTFEAAPTAVYLYKDGATANISGGTFTATGTDKNFLLNKLDAVRDTTEFNVTGGTFYDFDPMNNAAEGANTDFVDPALASTAGTQAGSFIIVEAVARVNEGLRYPTLAEAVEAAEAGDTVLVLKDNTEAITIPVGVTIDLNGKTTGALSAPAGYEVVDGSAAGTKTVARKAIVINMDDQTPTLIKVDEDWITANVSENALTDVVKAKLESVAANGLKVWQNYVMGVDGSNAANKLTTDYAVGAGEMITVKTPISAFNVPADCGITVTYRLLRTTTPEDAASWSTFTEGAARPEFPVNLATQTGDTYWKIEAVFTGAKAE